MEIKRIAFVEGDGAAPEMMRQATRIAIAAARMDNIEIHICSDSNGLVCF